MRRIVLKAVLPVACGVAVVLGALVFSQDAASDRANQAGQAGQADRSVTLAALDLNWG
ncbi:hypothetical protein HUT16_17790 [Kitasatospora sp. NA04385]|uniref:hypothetical protein n=1 Tax=Kitasatospora sp. NA04385 TaxID=2742135 RepID=UPI00158FF229|nr:hypothetical protein [Kitasatospora sp. NA04385]QKW20674.1 hypothetical protein HUT16_17790 [Kitasatospora sp. NA04385]